MFLLVFIYLFILYLYSSSFQAHLKFDSFIYNQYNYLLVPYSNLLVVMSLSLSVCLSFSNKFRNFASIIYICMNAFNMPD